MIFTFFTAYIESMDPAQPIQQNQYAPAAQVSNSPGFSAKYVDPQKGNFFRYLILGLILVAFGSFIYTWVSNPMIVTVTGTGEVSVPATSATLSFSVSTNDASVKKAIADVKIKAASLRSYLKSIGVKEGDISESEVSVLPLSALVAGGTGFQGSISLTAKTSKVSDTSALVASLYQNGADIVAQPVISIEDQDVLEQKALDEAMMKAKKEAAIIAKKNFKFIKKIVNISQASSSSSASESTKSGSSEEGDASLSGEFKIAKAVSVSYMMW